MLLAQTTKGVIFKNNFISKWLVFVLYMYVVFFVPCLGFQVLIIFESDFKFLALFYLILIFKNLFFYIANCVNKNHYSL